MTILKLDIHSLRNIHHASIKPSGNLNFIYGDNGSGKSALLEAIFILARARSFRTANLKQAIEFDHSDLVVSAQALLNGQQQQLGIQVNQQKTQIHINREPKKKADLAYWLPTQLIHPKSYKLIDGGSQLRREYIDWGAFNLDPLFLSNWRHYKRALQQRNRLLKTRQLMQLNTWNRELVKYGELVSNLRQNYLEQLKPVLTELCGHFLARDDFELHYLNGWNDEFSLLYLLEYEQEKDLKYGYTHSGPHRADLEISFNGRKARDFVSRGQLKLLVLCLQLAQVKLQENSSRFPATILIDDFTAELDTENAGKLVKYLFSLNSQVFMSSTDLPDSRFVDNLSDVKLFHVEQGEVKEHPVAISRKK